MIAMIYCTTYHCLSFTSICNCKPYTSIVYCKQGIPNHLPLFTKQYHCTQYTNYVFLYEQNQNTVVYLLLSLYCMLRNVTQVINSYENKVVFLILYYCCHWTNNTQMIYWNKAFQIICLLLSLYTMHVIYCLCKERLLFNLSSPVTVHTKHVMYYLCKTSPYTVKKVREFPVPRQDVTTKLSLGGNNDVIIELFLPRGSLVSDIPAGDGKLVNLFLRCISSIISCHCAYTIHGLCIVYVKKTYSIYHLLSLYTLHKCMAYCLCKKSLLYHL